MTQHFIPAMFTCTDNDKEDIASNITDIEWLHKKGVAKLSEISWMDDDYVTCEDRDLNCMPWRIIYIGEFFFKDEIEFADAGTTDSDLANLPYAESLQNLTLGELKALSRFHPEANKSRVKAKRSSMDFGDEYHPDVSNLFLMNYTKNVYIPMEKYIERNTDKQGNCVHPVPILTAIGNRDYEGDYNGINKHLVGDWAFDVLCYHDEVPTGLDEFIPEFSFGG